MTVWEDERAPITSALRSERPDIPCPNCHQRGGVGFYYQEKKCQCRKCGQVFPIGGDMGYRQWADLEDWHDTDYPAFESEQRELGPVRQGALPFTRERQWAKNYVPEALGQLEGYKRKRAEMWDHAYATGRSPHVREIGQIRPDDEYIGYLDKYQRKADEGPHWKGTPENRWAPKPGSGWTPEQEAQWHQDYHAQKRQQYVTDPSSAYFDYENWLDWYGQHAPEQLAPHEARVTWQDVREVEFERTLPSHRWVDSPRP